MSDRARAINDLLHVGIRHQQSGRLHDAEFAFRRILAVAPRHADALHLLGMIAFQRGQGEAALSYITRAIAEKPKVALYHSNHAHVLMALGRFDQAVESYTTAARRQPDFPEVHTGLGLALRAAYRPLEAEASLREALRRAPSDPRTMGNLACLLIDGGRVREAEALLRDAMRLAPEDPQYPFNLGITLLLAGRLPEGFQAFERRLDVRPEGRRPFKQPQWQGEPLAGATLLVHAEEGFGDSLQMCRYVPLITGAARVVLEVPGALVRLMRSLAGPIDIIREGDDPPPFDLHCPMLSLPRAFATTLESIPARVPYLHPEPAEVTKWSERLAPCRGLKIGIAWAGGPYLGDVNRTRSLSFQQFTPLLGVPGTSFISLQKGAPAAQLAQSDHAHLVYDWTEELGDFADTAALMANLDLVISVDTSVSHLAGAMGRPVWLLNRSNTCWRYLLDRTDSPWYPTMRLFRQTQPGRWDDVVADVRAALVERLA